MEAGDPGEVLSRAETEHSACSAGAVLGTMGFAAALRTGGASGAGNLLGYGTSADIAMEEEVPHSFVGYGAFGWYG